MKSGSWTMRYAVALGTLLAASAALPGQKAMNMSVLKQDAQVFERILDERLRQSFSNPFAITGDPQASYLQGYGLVVSFHININRARVRTPFGERDVAGRSGSAHAGELGGESKEEQLRKIRELMIDCLGQYAAAIQQLNAHDRVSLSAHVEDRNELDPARRKTVVVVTAGRDDVDLFAMRRISQSQFRQRLHILQY